ncbi:MAG TPA: protein-tyrosine-phosphatase [Frankiaceae bacterium]|nr:protein-tyrosine-phosphatase [Frankiaceae bacterium]
MTFDLLFVCTGNICRSPTAELLAATRLPAEHFRVHSAGTYGLEGYGIEPGAARELTALGIDSAAFRARRLTPELVRDADLVLTATREHRSAVVTLDPKALPRTFTMRELARLLDHVEVPAGDDPADRARALVAAVAAARGRHPAPDPRDEDVADPYGRGEAAYAAAIEDITEALRRPLEVLAG